MLAVEKNGELLLPELYYVPLEAVEAEKQHPKSQDRIANANLPLLWAQSLWCLGIMISEGLLSKEDIGKLVFISHTLSLMYYTHTLLLHINNSLFIICVQILLGAIVR